MHAALATSEHGWAVRPYHADDEGALVYLLGVSYTRSRAGHRAGAHGAGRSGVGETPDRDAYDRQRAFLDAHLPIWRWLLAHADVTLVVDPEDRSIIWGWLVTSGETVVHALGCKRSLIKAGLAQDLILALAGDRWRAHQVVTLELPQLRRNRAGWRSTDLVDLDRPREWSMDPTWLTTRMVGR